MAAAGSMGTLGPVAGIAYREGMQPATFSALRAGIGAAILVVLLLTGQAAVVRLHALPSRQRVVLLVAVLVNGAMNLCLFLAFGRMAVGLVMAVFYLNPVITALLAAALGRERLTAVRVAGLALACGGLVLVLGGQVGTGASVDTAGLALALLAAAGHATYLVAIRGGFDDVPGVQATSLVLLGGLVISGTAALLLEAPAGTSAWAASPVAWVAVLAAATFGALPKAWIIGGVRRIGSTRASVALLTEPVVAVVVAALVLGQQPTPAQLAGGALVLAAVVLVQRPAPAVRAITTVPTA